MATYAVGDLQGCLKPLECLLQQVNFDPAADYLWLAGDLINRGPESLATLRFVYNLRERVSCVLGNHDLHLLAVADNYRQPSRGDTLNDILAAPDRAELLGWLGRQPLLHHDPALNFTMVHAGIPPQWSLAQAQACAREVEAVLQGPLRHDFFSTMYGNNPDVWSDSLEGPARWRLITNYFTRMRFCTPEGRLELATKEGPGAPPAGFAPWFSYPQRATRSDRIIFGHWAALEGKANTTNIYALDTGCVWGGSLTMLRLEDEHYFRCHC
jgi:bis(5'-nucleosyl)-tetraphosphatase (symmetrical)